MDGAGWNSEEYGTCNAEVNKFKNFHLGRGERKVRLKDSQFRGQAMKQVGDFTYVGSVFDSDGKVIQNIERRRTGSMQAFGTLRRRLWGRWEVSLKLKLKVFHAIVLPVLLHSAATWTLTRVEERRQVTF